MAEHSEYILEPLREAADFTLYRGRERGNQMPILAVAVAAEQPLASESSAARTRILASGRTRCGMGSSAARADSSPRASGPHS